MATRAERISDVAAQLRIGFIGLGVMGRPMVGHLLKAGYPVTVHVRRAGAADAVVAAGATVAASLAELGAACDVVFTNVTATADVEQVLLGLDGVLSGARPGTVAIDMSTITPAGARRIAAALGAKGVHMLDAPVTGGPAGAEAGTLTIMVGGDAAVLERVRPLLDRLGSKVVHVGPNGAGQIVKACNQLALLVNAEGVAEALSLGQRHGVDPRVVREVLMGGIAASRVLEVFGAKMAERQFTPGMRTRLYDKDLTIALDLAREAGGRLPAAEVVRTHLDELMARGEGERDLATLITLLER